MFRQLCAASLKRERGMFVLSMHGDLCEANKLALKSCKVTAAEPNEAIFLYSDPEKKFG